jgi:hypothetical protein
VPYSDNWKHKLVNTGMFEDTRCFYKRSMLYLKRPCATFFIDVDSVCGS